MMSYFRLIFSCFVLTLGIWFFNACSGAAGKRAAILGSINSGLETAELEKPVEELTDGEVEQVLDEQTEAEAEPEPDDPEEFNYFPYDLQLDTIAFMSCENNNYFTVKAGSFFSRSGLRLSEYFLKSQSSGNLKTLIESSTKYIASPHLSIAHKFDLISTLSGSTVFFPVRLNRVVDELIVSGNSRVNEVGGEFIEAKIANGNASALFARAFNGDYRLFLSYIGGQHNSTLHQTGGEWGVDAYGRVYSIRMDEYRDARYTLNSVSEEKRPEASSQMDWVCPDSLRLEIRRHSRNTFKSQEWYNTQSAAYRETCPLNPTQTWYNTQSESYRARCPLNPPLSNKSCCRAPPPDEVSCSDSNSGGVARQVAAAVLNNEWDINIGSKCISPKSSSVFCYNKITSRGYPFERVAVGDPDCGTSRKAYCPHFLSICVRKN